jgi:hypothetical protein
LQILPRWVVSIGLLAGIYVAAMTAAALWMPHEWDWQVLKWLSSGVTPAFSPEVGIVDVSWSPSNIAAGRRRIADFLDGLVKSQQRPAAVILDVEFDPCQSNPCGSPMDSADNALVNSIRSATQRFPVYATEQPRLGRDDAIIGPLDPQDPRIYGVVSGAAQTSFTAIPGSQGLFYRICYADVPFGDASGKVIGTENVWAMVARVLMTPRFVAASPACDQGHIPVRLGTPHGGTGPVVYPFTDARRFSSYPRFDGRMFLIVGTIRYDRLPFVDRSGPEVLGWALSNALDQASLVGEVPYYDVRPQNSMLLLLAPAFSMLVVLGYAALFFQLKRVRLLRWRRLSPWLAAGSATLVGLSVVFVFELTLLASHDIQPQVSLIAFGVILAAGLSGLRGSQILLEEANSIDAPPTEIYDYDVFISYARPDRAWVFEHVFVPFRDAVLPNGRKLSVFFDTESIRSGTGWQTTLSLAIDASRFIVPIYSETYFNQPYCKFEILRAHRKWILAGEESRCVLPIVLGHPVILAAVDDIQALRIDEHPDLVQQHLAEIVERISAGLRQEAGAS